jgi:2,7-dihydroxy-5-methyl-1-naphthoate 7-O-methyltransferase
VVATLGIAEHISAGITHIDDLAAASGADPGSLHRVLSHLVGEALFE